MSKHRVYWRTSILLVTTVLAVSGCARWSKQESIDETSLLPAPRKSLDSVTVETVLIRFPEHELSQLNEIWQLTDESIFEIDFRKRLDANGLRAGVIIGELPEIFRDRMAELSDEQATNALEHAGLAADVDNRTRRFQCRAGRSKELLVRRDLNEPLTVLSTMDGIVSGETFLAPTVQFEVKAFPRGDTKTAIELTPEVVHGDFKQSFVSNEFGVRSETSRSRKSWEELGMKFMLAPGQIFVASGTRPAKAVGSAFFTTETAEQEQEHVVLLLRVAETQLDELFAPENIAKANSMTER